MDSLFLALAAIVFLAYFIDATTGFGSSVVVLTLAVHFYELEKLVLIVIPLNIAIALYLVGRYRRFVDTRALFTFVIPLMLAGMPVGLAVFYLVGAEPLKMPFGVFVAAVAVGEVVRLLFFNADGRLRQLRRPWSLLWTFGGGVVHGLWASGGPLVVYWAGRTFEDKRVFRATLSAVWLIMNGLLLFVHLVGGRVTSDTLATSGVLLAPVAVGLVCGEWLHRYLPERSFKILVFSVLSLSGMSIVLSS
jgi:uncharacterized membrane protein YfcA